MPETYEARAWRDCSHILRSSNCYLTLFVGRPAFQTMGIAIGTLGAELEYYVVTLTSQQNFSEIGIKS